MLLSMLRSKIHRATITAKHLDYDGSITIDPNLVSAAAMLPNEKVHVLNLNNGNRFETYIIMGKPGNGEIGLNGPAARLGEVGDKVIIVAYALVEEARAAEHRPIIVKVDDRNRAVKD